MERQLYAVWRTVETQRVRYVIGSKVLIESDPHADSLISKLQLDCLFGQITTRGEGFRFSACLPASFEKNVLLGPKMRLSITEMHFTPIYGNDNTFS